jgi:hypothetical protein
MLAGSELSSALRSVASAATELWEFQAYAPHLD